MSGVVRQVTIRGRVQGVGFRYWIEHEAITRDLEGWVRNRRDGSVEAVFSGPSEIVADMIALSRRGPVSARVDAVTEEPAASDALTMRPHGERFSVLPTI